MPCLYCGKELALLKRLRGGGEFCSEAHRLRYREEYDELALNRLLQAKQQPEDTARKDSPASVLAGNPVAPASPAPTAPNGSKPAAAAPPAVGPAKHSVFTMPPVSSARAPEAPAAPNRTSQKQEP